MKIFNFFKIVTQGTINANLIELIFDLGKPKLVKHFSGAFMALKIFALYIILSSSDRISSKSFDHP